MLLFGPTMLEKKKWNYGKSFGRKWSGRKINRPATLLRAVDAFTFLHYYFPPLLWAFAGNTKQHKKKYKKKWKFNSTSPPTRAKRGGSMAKLILKYFLVLAIPVKEKNLKITFVIIILLVIQITLRSQAPNLLFNISPSPLAETEEFCY